jgi:phosphohistidine phosphatase SixA
MKRRAIFAVIWVAILGIGADGASPMTAAAPHGPHIVMIIRHAEKPDAEDDPNLSPRGYERAEALATVIPARFPRPDFLIATKRSKGSDRPIETITPLSKALKEKIDSKFKDDEVAEVAEAVLHDPRYSGKTVLIAWHHGKIPELARALGETDVPDKWNPKVFDRVWEIIYENGTVTWKNLPQEALPGDAVN